LIGIPLEFKGDRIYSCLKENGFPDPSTWDKIDLVDAFGFKSKYVQITYEDDETLKAREKVILVLQK